MKTSAAIPARRTDRGHRHVQRGIPAELVRVSAAAGVPARPKKRAEPAAATSRHIRTLVRIPQVDPITSLVPFVTEVKRRHHSGYERSADRFGCARSTRANCAGTQILRGREGREGRFSALAELVQMLNPKVRARGFDRRASSPLSRSWKGGGCAAAIPRHASAFLPRRREATAPPRVAAVRCDARGHPRGHFPRPTWRPPHPHPLSPPQRLPCQPSPRPRPHRQPVRRQRPPRPPRRLRPRGGSR